MEEQGINFATPGFLLFFSLVLLGHRILKPGVPRRAFLLGASWFFYACWDWRFLGLILLSTLVDFVAGERIFRADSRRQGKLWLGVSLGVNLGLLGFFKYFGFFVATMSELLESMGLSISVPVLDIVLPVGISFYTFQTLSYSIDIYRGQIRPADRFVDFALFVAFFPQLVAGPIVRAKDFLPQLERDRDPGGVEFLEGLDVFLIGLFKKVMIADMAAPLVDPVFADPALFSGSVCAAACLVFTLQIYFDFSAYSDMAIGFASMLGFTLTQNFRLPYLASSMTDFWRRWHISLSTWFRDYLYIPLGGSRCGPLLTYRNLVITFLLTGLWHGANWTFVAFGAWHGLLLLVERFLMGRRSARTGLHPARRLVGWAWCVLATTVGFAMFRSATMGEFFQIAARILEGAVGLDAWFSPLRFFYLLGAAVIYHLLRAGQMRQWAAAHLDSWIWRPFWYTTLILIMLSCAPLDEKAFIYFAF